MNILKGASKISTLAKKSAGFLNVFKKTVEGLEETNEAIAEEITTINKKVDELALQKQEGESIQLANENVIKNIKQLLGDDI